MVFQQSISINPPSKVVILDSVVRTYRRDREDRREKQVDHR